MTESLPRLFAKYLFGAAVGMIFVAAYNLARGATWPEVQEATPGYVVTAIVAAAVITAFAVWKQKRSASE